MVLCIFVGQLSFLSRFGLFPPTSISFKTIGAVAIFHPLNLALCGMLPASSSCEPYLTPSHCNKQLLGLIHVNKF